MQSVSSRIWTRVAVSISYDDNHYTMGYKGPFVRFISKTNNGEMIKNEKLNWDCKAIGVTKG